ncbi:hypothetical protein ACLOJK_000764 [Asimina triloba]
MEGGGRRRSGNCLCWLFLFAIVALVIVAVTLTVKNKLHRSALANRSPGGISKKYANALGIALKFFDVQKSGKLVDNKISWRGDSALKDGSKAGLDLSKGLYDAGDHIKFGLPMAFTATLLSWSILEYGDRMKAVDHLDSAEDALKWITDYLINCHPSENKLYIQVGDPEKDHECWERPETMSEKRPLTQINTSYPGSEVAAETAAALASASLVFKDINTSYSDLLIEHADGLFTFADTHRGIYSASIPQVQTYYNSTGYTDELLWAAAWLYHATGDESYLFYATVDNGDKFAEWGTPSWLSWDNKLPGAYVLMSRVSFFLSSGLSKPKKTSLQLYRKTAEAVMCGLLPDSPTATTSRTDGGLIWVSEWNSLQHPVAAAFLAVVYSDYMLASGTSEFSCEGASFTPEDLRNFAISQADYVLGKNPMKMSYLVGYGEAYPLQVHHRGASIPADAKTGCKGFKWLDSTEANPNVAVGAMVGGPFLNETYIDIRNNSMQGEPTTYNSAMIVGLLSGLVATSSVAQSFSADTLS